jgi:hypothetical protein
MFDPYRSSLIAPDHLLFGLAQDVLNAVVAMSSPRIREDADALMREALTSHGLGKQRQILSSSRAALHTMTMSDMFAVLLVAPASFSNALAMNATYRAEAVAVQTEGSTRSAQRVPAGRLPKRRRKTSVPVDESSSLGGNSTPRVSSVPGDSGVRMLRRTLALLGSFQRLVSETQFWPRLELDGVAAIAEHNERGGSARHDLLFGMACDYIDALHALCVESSDKIGKILNKPNVHRLLELYAHTIPAFGHCRFVEELAFESAHQPLKRAIVRSNRRDPQLAAVTAVLANDWESRLSIELSRLSQPNLPRDRRSWHGSLPG